MIKHDKLPPRRSAMSRFAKPSHKRVARALGYALTLGADFDAWRDFSHIAQARLTRTERCMAAWAFLRSLDREDAAKTSNAILGDAQSAVRPVPMFDPGDADLWASAASQAELAGFASAALDHLGGAARDAVLRQARRAA